MGAPPASARSLRLLIVSSDTFPPTRVDVAVLFGQELAGRGHHLDWLLQSAAPCERSYVTNWGGGSVWVGPTDLGNALWRRVRKHVRGIWHDLRLLGLARRGGYDAILVKDKFVSGLAALIATRGGRGRFIYWLSYPFPEAYLLGARDRTGLLAFLYRLRGLSFKFLLYRVLLPKADHIFVQSQQMRSDVSAEGIPSSRMTAVPMGVDAAMFASFAGTQSRPAPRAKQKNVLYLGTLARVRRMDFLIRVLAKVLPLAPGTRLYLVGAGDEPEDEQRLVDEARRLDVLEAVEFVGQLPREQALKYVQAADVCVSPFYPTPILNSTSPTKLVEYMAMGKAVVANDHPEQRRVIEESGAGYCVPYEEEAFAKAVAALLNAPELASRMGQRGREYVMEHRTYSVIASAVERDLLHVAGYSER